MSQRASIWNVTPLLVVFIMVAALPITGFGDVPQQVNYQGKLTDDAGTPLSGTFPITFRLYDADETNPTPNLLWMETQPSVSVQNGIFNVHLGSVTSWDTAVQSSTGEYWIEVEVEGPGGAEILTPRQLVTSVFFAFASGDADQAAFADDADKVDGFEGAALDQSAHLLDTANPHAVSATQIGATTTAELATHAGIADAHHAKTTSFADLTDQASDPQIPDGIARDFEISWTNLLNIPAGFADGTDNGTTYTPGTGINIIGTTLNVNVPLVLSQSSTSSTIQGTNTGSGTGVFGRNSAGSEGSLGGALGANQIGVWGQAADTDLSESFGVYGAAAGSQGRGVAGYAFNSGAVLNYGGYFEAWGSSGRGIHGQATGISGRGVHGEATGNSGRGVYGYATGTSGRGVYGQATGSYARGVYGQAPAVGAVTNYGGYFTAAGDTGEGVYGYASGTSGTGVHGKANSSDQTKAGVLGENDGTGPGVRGDNNGSGNFGTLGNSSSGVTGSSTNQTGVYGFSGSGKAGHFVGTGTAVSGSTLYAQNLSPTGIAGFFQTASTDATMVLFQQGSGDILRGFQDTIDGEGFKVQIRSDGYTRVSVLELTGGSDLSEQFDIAKAETGLDPLPGMVVSIDPDNPGQLMVTDRAYDRRVAGIISGAGGVKPGMLMGQKGSVANGANPVALSGRVYCLTDASFGSIAPGDMLTTSKTLGHAMRVSDHEKAYGSVIGKAMTSLNEGKGLVLVLVNLQ